MRKIMDRMIIIARDQNRVFVELARARKLSPAEAVERYDLDPGKGNAYIEFDVESQELQSSYNLQAKANEFSIIGDVDLSRRNPEQFVNVFG